MQTWLVEREKDEVIVSIFKNKIDNTYSFVNLTKEHICPCKFKSIEEAIGDMEKQKKEGKIVRYSELRKL